MVLVKSKNNSAGFTLAELMVAMLVSTVVLGIAYTSYIMFFKNIHRENSISEFRLNAEKSVELFKREILNAREFVEISEDKIIYLDKDKKQKQFGGLVEGLFFEGIKNVKLKGFKITVWGSENVSEYEEEDGSMAEEESGASSNLFNEEEPLTFRDMDEDGNGSLEGAETSKVQLFLFEIILAKMNEPLGENSYDEESLETEKELRYSIKLHCRK